VEDAVGAGAGAGGVAEEEARESAVVVVAAAKAVVVELTEEEEEEEESVPQRGRARVPGVLGRGVEEVEAGAVDPPWRDPGAVVEAATLDNRADLLSDREAVVVCAPEAVVEAVRRDYLASAVAAVAEIDLEFQAAAQACLIVLQQGQVPVRAVVAAVATL
jgi:hypothetical protein